MKKILIGLIGFMGLIGVVGCEKEQVNTPSETSQGHDIYYSINDGNVMSGLSGTTAHINTETEFDALLDHFCDYAQEGAQVMFCSVSSNGKGSSTNTPTSISTNDREELKAWMKEMEKAGKTVQVTYDEGSNTWNGRAYANLGSNDTQEAQSYNGSLVFVPAPVLEEPPMGGVVWAMQVSADSTLIITLHGMMMWNDSISDDMRLIEGATVMLEGVAGTYTDLQGTTYRILEVVDSENVIIIE